MKIYSDEEMQKLSKIVLELKTLRPENLKANQTDLVANTASVFSGDIEKIKTLIEQKNFEKILNDLLIACDPIYGQRSFRIFKNRISAVLVLQEMFANPETPYSYLLSAVEECCHHAKLKEIGDIRVEDILFPLLTRFDLNAKFLDSVLIRVLDIEPLYHADFMETIRLVLNNPNTSAETINYYMKEVEKNPKGVLSKWFRWGFILSLRNSPPLLFQNYLNYFKSSREMRFSVAPFEEAFNNPNCPKEFFSEVYSLLQMNKFSDELIFLAALHPNCPSSITIHFLEQSRSYWETNALHLIKPLETKMNMVLLEYGYEKDILENLPFSFKKTILLGS